MPANKTQHFVPRCHLRPFSRDGEGKAINLFNLDGDRAIADAKVKKQCAGDYFYGDDLILEKLLAVFEDRYSERLRSILSLKHQLTIEDADLLKQFWLLQFLRTDAAARSEVQVIEQMDRELGGLPPGYLTTLKEAVQTAMRIFFERPGAVADLSVRLVRNRTRRQFITSDNPAVMTNRWHLTGRRTDLLGAGLENAGMIGFLPLSAEALCLIYDADLYSVPHLDGWIDASAEDVDAFNEQQVLSCQSNVYFRDWDDRTYVAELVQAASSRRLPARYELKHAVFDHEDRGTVTFREAPADEARNHQRSMVHLQGRLPLPSRWPRLIRWRSGGSVYDSQSGSGFLRKGTRAPNQTYKKIRVRV